MLSIGLASVSSLDWPSAAGLPSHPPEPENGTATTGEAAPFSGSGGRDGKPGADGQSQREAGANPMRSMAVVAADYGETLGQAGRRGPLFPRADREGGPPRRV